VPALLAPALALAMVLAVAGAAKVLDPTMTVGALRALHLPASPGLVRLGAAAELGLAVAAVTLSGPWPYVLISVTMLGFAAFVVVALRRGTMIGSCGCFGREDTPPHWIHVVLDLLLAGVAGVAATFEQAPLELLADDPGDGFAVVVLAVLLAGLLYATFVDLPRVLTEARSVALARGARR
jgi:hypothetical protein